MPADAFILTYNLVGSGFDYSNSLELLQASDTRSLVTAMSQIGLAGPPGPPGPSAVDVDPGDFTLTFDNQLI